MQITSRYRTIAEQNRIILDASTRRFQAHKIYLRASAAMRWVHMRSQLLRGEKPNARHVQDLRRIDQHLREVRNQASEIRSPSQLHVVYYTG
jgi:division protein CdvB (Snf7/Vps24/ESCRT-III family)